MKVTRVRFSLDVEVIAKGDWEFVLDGDGELRLVNGDSSVSADRDLLIGDMVATLMRATRDDGDLVWFVGNVS